ncbi:50S ribosomal protein L18Ae [uncultured archaeon]|nr:50S ribosomal protein L18Ae [uncultured archaeon]
MAKFVVTGKASGRTFEKVVEAANEKMAREKVLSLFGSNAGIKRSAIHIASAEKVS